MCSSEVFDLFSFSLVSCKRKKRKFKIKNLSKILNLGYVIHLEKNENTVGYEGLLNLTKLKKERLQKRFLNFKYCTEIHTGLSQ